MTHEEIRANLLAAMDGTLDPDALDEIERHMAECADCRMEQVELHRMRRSMDRQEEAAAPPAKRSFPGLAGGGMSRVLLIVIFMGAALWAMSRRNVPAASSRPSPPEGARVVPMGEGVAAGPAGRLSRIVRDAGLQPGDEVAVPRGARAIVRMGSGRALVLEGPAAGEMQASGGWRHRGGRLLAAATGRGFPLCVGASSAVVVRDGFVAAWDSPEGTRIEFLDGSLSELIEPGSLSSRPVSAERPEWAQDLRDLLGEPLSAVVPGVTLIPEGR